MPRRVRFAFVDPLLNTMLCSPAKGRSTVLYPHAREREAAPKFGSPSDPRSLDPKLSPSTLGLDVRRAGRARQSPSAARALSHHGGDLIHLSGASGEPSRSRSAFSIGRGSASRSRAHAALSAFDRQRPSSAHAHARQAPRTVSAPVGVVGGEPVEHLLQRVDDQRAGSCGNTSVGRGSDQRAAALPADGHVDHEPEPLVVVGLQIQARAPCGRPSSG